jgi:hypothetical protein
MHLTDQRRDRLCPGLISHTAAPRPKWEVFPDQSRGFPRCGGGTDAAMLFLRSPYMLRYLFERTFPDDLQRLVMISFRELWHRLEANNFGAEVM